METKELRHWLYDEMRKAEAEHDLCKKEKEYDSGYSYGKATAYRLTLDHLPYDNDKDRDPRDFPAAPHATCTGNAVVKGILDFILDIRRGGRTIEEFLNDKEKIFPTIVAFTEGRGYRVSGIFEKHSGMKSKYVKNPYEKITQDFPVPITEKAIVEFGFFPARHTKGPHHHFRTYYLTNNETWPDHKVFAMPEDEFIRTFCCDWVILHETVDTETMTKSYGLEVRPHNSQTFSGEVRTMYEVLMALRLCRVALPLEN